jgi:hypothetical protein
MQYLTAAKSEMECGMNTSKGKNVSSFLTFLISIELMNEKKTLLAEKQLPTTWKIKSPAKIAGGKLRKMLLNVVVLSVKNSVL